MKAFLFLCAITVVMTLSSCQGGQPNQPELDIDAIKTVQDLNQAEQSLDESTKSVDADGTADYARLAEKALSLSRLLDAERLYQKSLWQNPANPDRQASLTGLIQLYQDRLRYVHVAEMICCSRQSADTTCCPKGEMNADSIQVLLRQEIVADSTGEFSRQGGRQYIAFSQTYALLYPDRQNAPAYLNEAAKLALSLRMPSKGIELYQWIYTHFPASDAAPKARFLEGFTYENELKDLEAAKAAYEAYLEQYPQDVFAKDARILLDNLGVDPEEMIRRFENQQ